MATKVVNQETTTYTWDFRNKMLKVDFPSGDDPVMRYDGDGTRAKKVVGATTTLFLYDVTMALPALLFETDASLNQVAEYRRGPGGALIAMQRSSTLYWYHFDRLGSTLGLTNSSETVTDTYRYDAWGKVTASSGTTTNPLRFSAALGDYDDGDVGLLHDARSEYDPGTGRYLRAQPAALRGTGPAPSHRHPIGCPSSYGIEKPPIVPGSCNATISNYCNMLAYKCRIYTGAQYCADDCRHSCLWKYCERRMPPPKFKEDWSKWKLPPPKNPPTRWRTAMIFCRCLRKHWAGTAGGTLPDFPYPTRRECPF